MEIKIIKLCLSLLLIFYFDLWILRDNFSIGLYIIQVIIAILADNILSGKED